MYIWSVEYSFSPSFIHTISGSLRPSIAQPSRAMLPWVTVRLVGFLVKRIPRGVKAHTTEAREVNDCQRKRSAHATRQKSTVVLFLIYYNQDGCIESKKVEVEEYSCLKSDIQDTEDLKKYFIL